jgi:hypothetical protein
VTADISRPARALLAPGLEISRLVTGLWQVADMERGGTLLDPVKGAADMAAYAAAGFDTFDMADHYGSAEVITGELLNRADGRGVRAFTKWCPPPGPMTPEVVRAGVQRSLDRMRTSRIDLMQFHWWTFEHPGWLDAMHELARLREEGLIGHLGLTGTRRQAAGLRHAGRWLPVRALAGPRRARRGGRLEQDEIPPLHRRGGRLGRAAGRAAGRRPRGEEAWRVDRQRGHALGARSTRGGGGDRRRAPG